MTAGGDSMANPCSSRIPSSRAAPVLRRRIASQNIALLRCPVLISPFALRQGKEFRFLRCLGVSDGVSNRRPGTSLASQLAPVCFTGPNSIPQTPERVKGA